MTGWRWAITGLVAALTAVAPTGRAAEGEWRLVIDYSEYNQAAMSGLKPTGPFLDLLMRSAGLRKYVADEDKCDAGTGLFVGGAQIEGRFLPNSEQLLVHYATRDCEEAPKWAKGHLMLLQDAKVVAYLQPKCGTRIDAIVTLAGSRLQRVIIGCGGGGQGYFMRKAGIFGYDAQADKFQRLHNLGTVFADDCGAKEHGTETVAVIYERKSSGELRIKNYARSCASQAQDIKDYRFLYNGPIRVEY